MATSHRPGQVRFEAWVPEDLFLAFKAKHQGSRKGWLVRALRDEVWGPEGHSGAGAEVRTSPVVPYTADGTPE